MAEFRRELERIDSGYPVLHTVLRRLLLQYRASSSMGPSMDLVHSHCDLDNLVHAVAAEPLGQEPEVTGDSRLFLANHFTLPRRDDPTRLQPALVARYGCRWVPFNYRDVQRSRGARPVRL